MLKTSIMKTPGIKLIATFIFCAMISCNTEKPYTQNTKNGQGKHKNAGAKRNPNKTNKQNQSTSSETARVNPYNNNDTCTTCCDPLLEIDPKFLVLDKNK